MIDDDDDDVEAVRGLHVVCAALRTSWDRMDGAKSIGLSA
jgi:hypothetical protein